MRPELKQEYADYVRGRLPRLHRAAYLLCGDAHRADDIVQTALTSLYLNWERAAVADNIDGYVHRILVRRYLDERRLRWSGVRLSDSPPGAATAAAADDRVADRHELVTALRALPKGQRAVLVLRFITDLTVEDTARALGCSVGNVKSQSARGLATLRELFSDAKVGNQA